MLCAHQPPFQTRDLYHFALPDAHARARDSRQLHGSRESLITLRIVVLESNLKFHSLEKIPFLLILRVVEERSNIRAHSGCRTISNFIQGSAGAEEISPTVIFDMAATVFQKNTSFLW